ncbi:MarR family transcriptional regulator [Actinoplanes sp. NEAU-A12]|uniref:MarR family transcriptional regulator n=1 Tax=Actinoplanes sandaracinus TaxID=3045177 RepID=A0ABT6WGQ3_9ACTN|nr:MarR family transcriptional regulator [Actinoplanes sandaracinus]MDI6098908.1 MarR family transcriptional regulator [Actinoplanes sandaracinus]
MSKRDLAGSVATELRLLQQSFDAFDEAVATTLKLNRTDLRALDLLLTGEGRLSAGELSQALKLSPAATTTVIDRLERAGFADRIADPHNRRRVLVAATEAARAAERDIYAPVGVAGAEALAEYDLDQLATIHHFLQTARRVQEEQATRISRRQPEHP